MKFSQTNRIHFSTGEPMGNPMLEIREQKPPKPPLPLAGRGPHLTHQCLGRPHTPPETAAPMVHALPHSYAANSPLVTIGRPIFAPKITPSRGPIPKPNYLPHPWTHPTYHPKRHLYLISRFATMHWTDRQTDDRPQQMVGGIFDDNRPLTLDSDMA